MSHLSRGLESSLACAISSESCVCSSVQDCNQFACLEEHKGDLQCTFKPASQLQPGRLCDILSWVCRDSGISCTTGSQPILSSLDEITRLCGIVLAIVMD